MRHGDRGVSEVLGALLVFGIVVMLLGILQTMAVPQQNEDVEFKHSQQVRDEMVDLRAVAMESARTGETLTSSVTLGTDYPTRFVLLNPSAATGTLRTTEGGSISSPSSNFDPQDVCGTSGPVDSRSVVYEPQYNAYQSAPTTGFEHGFAFREYDNGVRIENEQMLLRGDTITLLPFSDSYYESGIETAPIDISSTGMGTTSLSTGSEDFTVRVPTQLDAAVWKSNDKLLGDEFGDKIETIKDADDPGHIDITFDGGEYTVRCAVLGTDLPPEANPPRRGDGGLSINPNAEGEVILTETDIVDSDDSELTFEYNPAPSESTDSVDIVGGRISFYSVGGPGDSGGSMPTEGDILQDGDDRTTLVVGGEFEELDSDLTVDSDGEAVTIDFDESVQAGHWYVLTLEYSNGKVSTYFAAHEGPGNGEESGDGE